jgi:hypothetical protein
VIGHNVIFEDFWLTTGQSDWRDHGAPERIFKQTRGDNEGVVVDATDLLPPATPLPPLVI